MSAHAHHGAHKHAAQLPFVDFHCTVKDGIADIEGILPITSVENLLTGVYVDGSRSTLDEHGIGNIIQKMLGQSVNQVDDSMKAILPYIIGMDSTNSTRVVYWASGNGRQLKVVDPEMDIAEAAAMTFVGPGRPSDFGSSTYLLPALRDFIVYVQERRQAGEKVDAAIGLFMTDGQIHDLEDVISYVKEIEKKIRDKAIPKIVISIVGVGQEVDENQLEELLHDTFTDDATSAVVCYNVIDEMPDVSAIVAHLADANMFAMRGGARILDSAGNVLASWEDGVPALIELQVPANIGHIVFEASGKTFEIEIDEDDDHEGGEHHDDDDDDHKPAGHGGHHGH